MRSACIFTGKPGLPSLPVFGLGFKLPVRDGRFSWYGRGPWENYPDRKAGEASWAGMRAAPRESMAKYLVPQECGTHMDTRWLEVEGLRFEALGQALCLQRASLFRHGAGECGPWK